MNSPLNLMNDFKDVFHISNVDNNYIYHFTFIGYLISKYKITKYNDSSLAIFLNDINEQLKNLSFSSYELNLFNRVLNDLLLSFDSNSIDLKKYLALFDKYDMKDYKIVSAFDFENEIDRFSMEVPSSVCDLVNGLLNINKSKSILNINSGKGNYLVNTINQKPNIVITAIEKKESNNLILDIRLYLFNADYEIQSNCDHQINAYYGYDSIFCLTPFTEKDDSFFKNLKFDFQSGISSIWKYVELSVKCLNPNGKAVVILPLGPLFKNPDSSYREYLVKEGLLEAIIELPENLFYGTGISTAILVLSRNNKRVKLLNAKDMISNIDKKINLLETNRIIESYNSDNIDYVDYVDMKDNKFSFIINTYLDNTSNMNNPTKLKDMAQIFRGYRINKHIDKSNDSCKIINLTDMKEQFIDTTDLIEIPYNSTMERYLLNNEDIIITAKGSKFQCSMIHIENDEKIVVSENQYVLRTDINPYYLLELLNSDEGKKSIFSKLPKTTVMSIPIKEFQEIYLDLKSEFIQEKIGKLVKEKYEINKDYKKRILKINEAISQFDKK